MIYHYEGEITLLKHLTFADNDRLDIKPSRPYLLLCDYEISDNTAYLLKLSTSVGKKDKNFYKLLPNKKNGLKRPSYIDLRYVVEVDFRRKKVIGEISETNLLKIKNKLEQCQKVLNDKGYKNYLNHIAT